METARSCFNRRVLAGLVLARCLLISERQGRPVPTQEGHRFRQSRSGFQVVLTGQQPGRTIIQVVPKGRAGGVGESWSRWTTEPHCAKWLLPRPGSMLRQQKLTWKRPGVVEWQRQSKTGGRAQLYSGTPPRFADAVPAAAPLHWVLFRKIPLTARLEASPPQDSVVFSDPETGGRFRFSKTLCHRRHRPGIAIAHGVGGRGILRNWFGVAVRSRYQG